MNFLRKHAGHIFTVGPSSTKKQKCARCLPNQSDGWISWMKSVNVWRNEIHTIPYDNERDVPGFIYTFGKAQIDSQVASWFSLIQPIVSGGRVRIDAECWVNKIKPKNILGRVSQLELRTVYPTSAPIWALSIIHAMDKHTAPCPDDVRGQDVWGPVARASQMCRTRSSGL